jgi:hypothetical protein
MGHKPTVFSFDLEFHHSYFRPEGLTKTKRKFQEFRSVGFLKAPPAHEIPVMIKLVTRSVNLVAVVKYYENCGDNVIILSF